MNANTISLTNISKIYRTPRLDITANNNITLTLSPSEITVLIGKSGCGKSTLLNIINGLCIPDTGVVTMPEGFKTATVFQEHRLFSWLTLSQNAGFWCDKDVDSMFEEFGIAEFKHLYPAQSSGGMNAKTSLIRALACGADYLLLDEPFASIDYLTRLSMQTHLRNIKSGMLFVTHSIEEAVYLGDTILIMDKGAVTAQFKNPAAHRTHKNLDKNLYNKILDSIDIKE